MNRLPKAVVVRVSDQVMPRCYGMTIQDDFVVRPVILLNRSTPHHWGKTLIHEMIHVAEPELRHGKTFEALVTTYWRLARTYVKGLR